MFSHSVNPFVPQILHQSPWLTGLGSVFAFLLAWRLWRFTIIPLLYPGKPKELPYWIPFLGYGLSFFLNSYQVLEIGRKYFRNSKEPYSITLSGQTLYVITSPEDVQQLYKETVTISWLRFVQDLYRWIGISQPNIDKLWTPPTETQKASNPVRKLPPNQMVESYQHDQLLPGAKMDEIAKCFVADVDSKLQWQCLHDEPRPYVNIISRDVMQLSLMDWTADVFINTTTEMYWGKSIWKVAPGLTESFLKWEETTWKYVFQLPRFLSKDMYTARDQLIGAFRAYFAQPNAERADANYFVKMAEEELRDIEFGDFDVAKANMLQHWAINGNVHKVTFWVFAYLFHTPGLLEAIREETAPGIVNDTPDVRYLTEKCPRLEAIFLEVLRLKMSTSLMRYVTSPTLIGGKLLEKGHNVMVPYRQLHFDKDVWGENVVEFDPERFLKQKHLVRSSSYRPFGGGQHLCSGRFLARHAVFSFVALVLARYDVGLATIGDKDSCYRGASGCGQRFPRADESKPGLGTLSPLPGDNVILRLTPRGREGRDEKW